MKHKNSNNNKACLAKLQRSKGFAILFAVTLSAILLSIALGVTEIAYKQLKFSTSAKSTNDAFFAADTGIECALLYSKSTIPVFPSTINCASQNISVNIVLSEPNTYLDFVITGLGNSRTSCAKVNITQGELETIVNSKGYDTGDSSCNPTNPDRIEREVETRY